MLKQDRKIIDKLLTCLDDRIFKIPSTKEELLVVLDKASFPDLFCFYDSDMGWNKGRVRTEIKLLSNETFEKLVSGLRRQVQQRNREQNLAEMVYNRLKSRFPNEQFEIIEFVEWDKYNFGIKIVMCDEKYLLDHNGTINELIQDLIEEVNEKSKNRIK